MKISIGRAVWIAVSLVLSISAARDAIAAEAQYFNATDRVSQGSGLTYFDLALQFAQGLASKPANDAGLSKLPRLGGNEYPTTIANPSIGSVRRIDIQLDGKPALLLMFDLGYADESIESVNILALFDMSGTPRLLDAIDVGLDKETSFLEPGHMELSPKFGMTFVRNSHHNAGEEYLQTSLIGIWGGKLHAVDTIFSMSWLAGNSSLRVWPSFALVKGTLALDATFEVKTIHCDDGCEPDVEYPAIIDRLTTRYSWDAAAHKFSRPEHAFDRIPLMEE